ncbi:hypothetical protein [Granulicella sp. L60]|uniref:hypothetical protein n=1 Tax=Granulicella sp. L60 TaxID=1641866 RepID=UPI00131E4709|nr:hypothetical protein [Granulicella sp. L60]
MSEVAFQKTVGDSVPKINDEVAVGEDLDFQRKWWKFESVMWWIIALLLLLNFAGVFGRGPVAHAKLANDAMLVKYERVERTGTPSILEVQFKPNTLGRGQVKLHVSQSIVDGLGTQRVIPSPSDTAIGRGGLTYTFSAEQAPGSVQFALQPSRPGIFEFTLQVPGSSPLSAKVVVMP